MRTLEATWMFERSQTVRTLSMRYERRSTFWEEARVADCSESERTERRSVGWEGGRCA